MSPPIATPLTNELRVIRAMLDPHGVAGLCLDRLLPQIEITERSYRAILADQADQDLLDARCAGRPN